MEIWDIYDKDRIKTGETMVRGSAVSGDTSQLAAEREVYEEIGMVHILNKFIILI